MNTIASPLTPSIFNFHQHQLRGALIDQQPWVVAKDLCETLGLTNSRDVVRRTLDAEEWTVYEIHTPSRGKVRMQVVNESGVWALVIKSRKPEAKAVRKWLTSEVIPALRSTGSYTMPEAKEVTQPLANPVGAAPAKAKALPGGLPAGVLDARGIPCTLVKLLSGEVRMVGLEGKQWYSLRDVMQCVGRPALSAHATAGTMPAGHKAMIRLYGSAAAGWFVDETGVRLLAGSRSMLRSQLTLNLAN